jgi:transposase
VHKWRGRCAPPGSRWLEIRRATATLCPAAKIDDWSKEVLPWRVSAKGAFWFATYAGGLNGTLFVTLLRRMMGGRRKPLHLIVDGLPAHRTRLVRDYVNKLECKLTLHFLPGYAPDLNPDELVWSHAKRTGNARRPLLKGERLEQRVAAQLADIGKRPSLVRSFFRHPSVAYIADC